MKGLTRRDLLKTSLMAPAAVAVARQAVANGKVAMDVPGEGAAAGALPAGATPDSPGPRTGRERLLLDFGWRFHFGHANDAAKDFGFGGGRPAASRRPGDFLPRHLAFDDSDWKPVDLPHDWAVELPFQNDPALASKGFYPLGRDLPGDQRRLVSPRLRTSRLRRGQAHHDRVRRLVPGNHGGLQRLLHRPAQRRLRSVQLRCDRFRESGRKERAAGPRGRHLERRLVLRGRGHLPARLAGEDAPVHVKKWGTFVRAQVRPGEARFPSARRWRTTARARKTCASSRRSWIPPARRSGKRPPPPASVPEWGEHTYEQQVVVNQPALWSLEERNLYKLVTEVESGGDRHGPLRDAASAFAP